MPTDRISFRHDAVRHAYEAAERAVANLPAAERTAALTEVAARLKTLDARKNIDDDQRAVEATRIVAAHRPAAVARGAEPPPPTDARRSVDDTVIRLTVAPGVVLDANDGMPLVDGKRPRTWAGLADGLYSLAAAVDRSNRGDLLAVLPARQREKLLETVLSTLDGKALPTPMQLSGDQALQLRATASTLLTALVEVYAADATPSGSRSLGRAVDAAEKLARDETNPVLKESMVFGLYRLQTELPPELRDKTRALMRELPTLTPPYDAWLEDGKIGVDFVVDGAAATVVETIADLEAMGFARVGTSEPALMRQTVGEGSKQAVIEVKIRENNDDIFANLSKADVDIVWFSGHANYGRAIPTSVSAAGAATGKDKLVIHDSCWGKDNMHHVRRSFPEAELLATFHSSTYSESLDLQRTLWPAIAARKSWAAISEDLGGTESSNWLTPAEIMLRRRQLDADGDGRADSLDRLFDVNLQRPEESLEQAFTAREPGAMPHRLQAWPAEAAATWANRGATGYNPVLREVNEGARVVAGGFFTGGPGDPPVRYAATTLPDGQPGYELTVNHRFSHMPEEALRAVAAYELSQFLADHEPRFAYHHDPVRARINGLMSVVFTLSHDLYYNDDAVWRAFGQAYRLPADLSRDELEAAIRESSAFDGDGGSADAVDGYLKKLETDHPDFLAALGLEAGSWPRPVTAAAAGLPETVYASELAQVTHGVCDNDYYCEQANFVAQTLAGRADSSVVSNAHGEKLVGFLHVPRDSFSENTLTGYTQAERHVASREVLGRAIAGYADAIARDRREGPIKILLTGFGPFDEVKNNPTAELVSKAENADAAMLAAFGDRLVSAQGVAAPLDPTTSARTRRYEVRDRHTGEVRTVDSLLLLNVKDEAVDPRAAHSLPMAMKTLAPQAVISLGVRSVTGNEFRAEPRADNNGLSADVRRALGLPETGVLVHAGSFSLARAIQGAP